MLVFATAVIDFDGDGHLGPSDLKEMLDYYTGKDEKLDDVHKERLVQEVGAHQFILVGVELRWHSLCEGICHCNRVMCMVSVCSCLHCRYCLN